MLRPWIVLLCAASLAACLSPRAKIDEFAHRADLMREVVPGTSFRHVVYRPRLPRTGPELHVYIEGDGTPYVNRYTAAADPTPRDPVALTLMSEDPGRVLYIGRPCYFGLAADAGCNAEYWTLRRFSAEVVGSLAAVLENEIAGSGALRVTLIGHSGGATLALLLADRVPRVDRVVTVAGNLDVAAWTALHRYAPLKGSLDPVNGALSRSDVTMIHYAGAADSNVPASMIAAAAARLGGSVVIVPGFTHNCCWGKLWPEALCTLDAGAAQR